MIISLDRYATRRLALSDLDPMDDVTAWVTGLQSEHTLSTAFDRHPVAKSLRREARRIRVRAAAAHIEAALGLLSQAEASPDPCAFLPLYYALLNLSNVYVLFGPFADSLADQRWHGVRYVQKRVGRDLLTDTIKIVPRGAIPLFYRTVTGSRLSRTLAISMRNVYRYILDIAFEYSEAAGEPSPIGTFRMEATEENSTWRVEAVCVHEGSPPSDSPYGALRGLRRVTGESNKWSGPRVHTGPGIDVAAALRKCFRPYLLFEGYGPLETSLRGEPILVQIPRVGVQIEMFEELPILLAFYHLSMLVRYHPQQLSYLIDSQYWPMLLILRRHAILRFLILFYSFVRQQSYYLRPKIR